MPFSIPSSLTQTCKVHVDVVKFFNKQVQFPEAPHRTNIPCPNVHNVLLFPWKCSPFLPPFLRDVIKRQPSTGWVWDDSIISAISRGGLRGLPSSNLSGSTPGGLRHPWHNCLIMVVLHRVFGKPYQTGCHYHLSPYHQQK